MTTASSDRKLQLDGQVGEGIVFRCSGAGRWLPRVLAAAVLIAAVLAAFRFDPGTVLTASKYLRSLVAVLGGALALWIVRKGAEVRVVLVLSEEELLFRYGSREYALRLEDLERLSYETPFAQSRTWLPALVLRDRFGQPWRISAFISRGERLLEEILRRIDRSDLQTWSETLQLPKLLSRSRHRVLIGYIAAAAILIVGVAYYLH
jgi:hypothetical protein